MDDFHDNWEIVVEGYIRQHLKKFNLYHNLPHEIREWLWLFADILTTEEKHKLSVAIIGDLHQFMNTLPTNFETHSYYYTTEQWTDVKHVYESRHKKDAAIIIINIQTNNDTLKQTYTDWIHVLHHTGIKQMVFCIATKDKKYMVEAKYNEIKDAITKICSDIGYDNMENTIPFIPMDNINNTLYPSEEKEFCWYKGYDHMLIPSLHSTHSIHTLHDVLETVFQPRYFADIDKPFILSVDVDVDVDASGYVHCSGHILQGAMMDMIHMVHQRVKILNVNAYGTVIKSTHNRHSVGHAVDMVINMDDDMDTFGPGLLIGGVDTFDYKLNTRFRIMVKVIGDGTYVCNKQMEISLVHIYRQTMGHIENIECKLDGDKEISDVLYIEKGDKALIDICVSDAMYLVPWKQCESLGCIAIYESKPDDRYNGEIRRFLAMIGKVEQIMST